MSFTPYILLLLVIAGAALAARTPFPQAVVWSAIGLIVAFLPKFPSVLFDPQLALFFFLPPLVYSAAVDLPWPEFRDNIRPISMLAIGLVLVTAAGAAAVAHYVAGLPWAVAIVAGATISPTDPAAASAVAARVGIPRRLIAILEGEGLVNDAVALVIFRISVLAAVSGSFSFIDAAIRFFAILIGEPLYGWLLGVAIAEMRKHIEDPRLEIAVSLLTPFAAYLVPVYLGGSGILATVATGMYIGERRSTLVPAGTRLHATPVWQMVVFILSGFLFLVAGIELGVLLSSARLNVLKWGAEVAASAILLRFAWCFAAWYLLGALRRLFKREPHPDPLRYLVIVAWAGIRGPVSLAAAMSIPAFASGKSFADDQAILPMTAAVIICTLFLQGLTLPALVHSLGVAADVRREKEQMEAEQELARGEASAAALRALDEMESSGKVQGDLAKRIRREYQRFSGAPDPVEFSDGERDLLATLLDAERARILELRNAGRISDHALAALERRLDLRQSLIED